ncbi:MAG: serine hydrolase domain-containing protein [Nocardioides sp.]
MPSESPACPWPSCDDRIVHMRGFGHADQSGRAVSPQTPFIIGSVAKSGTALAIMQLVEAGTVKLDTPIVRYIPWFRVAEEGSHGRDAGLRVACCRRGRREVRGHERS